MLFPELQSGCVGGVRGGDGEEMAGEEERSIDTHVNFSAMIECKRTGRTHRGRIALMNQG